MEQISVQVKSVVFANAETGWAVLSTDCDGQPLAIVGKVGHLQPGDTAEVTGKWTTHPQHGEQFEVTGRVRVVQPSSRESVAWYLESVNGVGPVMAQRIVEHFEDDTMEVVWDEPERLQEVPGIGKDRAKAISEQLLDRQAEATIGMELHGCGVPDYLVPQLARRWKRDAVRRVRENPYALIEAVKGIGFKVADSIARRVGVALDSPIRARAGLMFLLREASSVGHCYVPAGTLVARTAKLLHRSGDALTDELAVLESEGRVVLDGEHIYPAGLHRREQQVAYLLARLAARTQPEFEVDTAEAEEDSFSPGQREALQVFRGGAAALVVTGGPGTGKTTIMRELLREANEAGLSMELCAPTGRAAARLSEVVGYPAATIHRMLGYRPAGTDPEGNPVGAHWAVNSGNPLWCDLLVCDEASMLDVGLAYRILDAVDPEVTRLVLVGDADQLPSVGPGRVLGDIIASEVIPTVRLRHVFRQAAESNIVAGAHSILSGAEPTWGKDLLLQERHTPAGVVDAVVRIARKIRTAGYEGSNGPVQDVVVLAPMRKGPVGVNALNDALQRALNPDGEDVGRGLRAGDRCMVVKNNYQLQVWNGDMGTVRARHGRNGLVVGMDDGREITMDASEAGTVVLAYATTIHKMQGSEARAVLLVCHRSHHHMLDRQLVYTAVTRATELLVVVGEPEAVLLSAQRARAAKRYTALDKQLQRAASAPHSEEWDGSDQEEETRPPAPAEGVKAGVSPATADDRITSMSAVTSQ